MQLLRISILTFFSLYILGCQSNPIEHIEETDLDTATVEVEFQDTLRLREGEIPQGWVKTDLGKGFYVAFPSEARREEGKHHVYFKFKKKDYTMFVSTRDLTNEASFTAHREDKATYYQAVVTDLVESLDLDEATMEVNRQQPFYLFRLYEGLETELEAVDVQIFMRCIIIDDVLYTISFIAWRAPTPTLLQVKARFLYSFSKDLAAH